MVSTLSCRRFHTYVHEEPTVHSPRSTALLQTKKPEQALAFLFYLWTEDCRSWTPLEFLSREVRCFAQLFFDSDQLVILRHPVRTGSGTSFNLPGIQGNR
jgi:hypothetical protein